jgi:hypothetical protein
MRISEITDAQGQLELLRTVIDNTWTAIAQQAEQERRAEAERKSQAKLKPRAKKSGKGTSIRIPTPPPPPNKKTQAPLVKQPPSSLNEPNPNALNAINPIPSINPQLKQPPINTAINPKLSIPYPKPIANTLTKQHYGVKDGYFGKNIGTTEKEDDGDDRHSKNGIANLKK